jgi:hypothetical protein
VESVEGKLEDEEGNMRLEEFYNKDKDGKWWAEE